VEENGELLLQTKGDANDSPDPSAVPASAFVGVVDGWVPAAGYGMILMSTPTGLISWLSFGLAMLVADAYIASLMKEREARSRSADAERAPSGKAAARKRRAKAADPTRPAEAAVRPKRATKAVAAGKLETKTADPPKPATRRRVGAAVAAPAARAARAGTSE
jgi:hypothetical protein